MATEHSPHSSNGGTPLSHTRNNNHNLVSPWAAVVRGDPDQISESAAPPMVTESSGSVIDEPQILSNEDDNVGRPVWNRRANGGVVETGPVMGGTVSWPALSESTRVGARQIEDGSAQAPVIPQSPQRQANANAHGNPATTSNTLSPRPRRNRAGGNSSGSGPSNNNSFHHRPAHLGPPPFPEIPHGAGSTMLDTPLRGPRPAGGSHSHSGNNDHSNNNQRNHSRRNNYGPRPRGDGPYHSNHGGRRDQDRRDVHIPPLAYGPPPMGYMPPALHPGAPPFMAPHMRLFPVPMGFDMGSSQYYVPTMSPEPFRPAMPMVPPHPSMVFTPAENPIVKQIDYYFSDENLVKDGFLRSNMDENGWVPITLIANFPRVQQLTGDVQVILDSLRFSAIVEVQGGKLRKRNGWDKWVRSPARLNNRTDSGSHAPEDVVATDLQQLSLDSSVTSSNGNAETTASRLSSSEELTNGEDTTKDAHSVSV